jgi:hypothetical protein
MYNVQLQNTIMNKDHEQEKHALFWEGIITQSKEVLTFPMWINPQDIKVEKPIGEGTYGAMCATSWLRCNLVVKIISMYCKRRWCYFQNLNT